MIGFRHADRRFPFLWEGPAQPPGRWHTTGDGPAHCFADTPDGAWAEFLRHEEITTSEDLATVERAIWAVEVPDGEYPVPELPPETLSGGWESHPPCQAEARHLVAAGAAGLRAPSAALALGAAGGWRVDGGLRRGSPRDPAVVVLFGPRPDLVGWRAAEGRPGDGLLPSVRHLTQADLE